MSSCGDDSSIIYDDTQESLKDYKHGGYHPVEVGDLFINRYLVVQKLGWGHFSTVWLCKDQTHGTYVAMKVQKSAPNYTEAALDEIDLLLRISKNVKEPLWATAVQKYHKPESTSIEKQGITAEDCYVVQLLNTFSHTGVHGTHVCLVFEVLGVNLLEIIKFYQYKGIPIGLTRSISKQVLIGLDYLHRICGIIHTDLKPENVIVQLTQAQVKELFVKGRIDIREPLAVVVKEQKLPICREISEKRLKKIEKKKRYRKRKQELKRLQTLATDSQALPSTSLPSNPPPKTSKVPQIHALEKTETLSHNSTEESLNSSEIDSNLKIKIADLGNACWLDHHFSTEIQTRQYRSPEVILGISYNHTADVWSFACMLFELLTGDFLFDPRSNGEFEKDEDHLAQMIETLGIMPKDWARSGEYSQKLLDANGDLKGIKQLKIWLLKEVLIEKYRFKPCEAESLSDFMLPMLKFRPEQRITAEKALAHPWLCESSTEYKMSEEEYQGFINESEVRRVEAIEKYTRDGYASSPEVPQEYSGDEADFEDNSSTESWFSEEAPVEKFVIREEEYHKGFKLQ